MMIEARLADSEQPLLAPEVLDLEILQALRRQLRLKNISLDRAASALQLFGSLPIARTSHQQLLPRIWQLRDNLTAYDAAYVALAEVMQAPLWTRDSKYLGASGHQAQVVVL